jgi:hypothetical protein
MILRSCVSRRAVLFMVIVTLLVSLPVGRTSAQSMTTVMLEQIAKLELYLKEAQQGYAIAQTGLTTIGQIKKGDFDLHSLFFSTLKNVNPAIKGWGKVADIIAMQVEILQGCAQTLSAVTGSGNFNASDLKYVTAVYSNLKDLTAKDIDELTSLVTDGTWQMTDDDRMNRIDQLFNHVEGKYLFLRSFSNRVLAENQIRIQQKAGLQTLTQLFQK